MGNGGNHHIKPITGNPLPPVPTEVAGKKSDASKADEQNPKNPKTDAGAVFNKSVQNLRADERRNNLAAQMPDNGNTLLHETVSLLQRQAEQAKNLLNQSLDELINLAKDHPSLEKFRGEPKSFWDDVKKMSALRTVETYVNGKLEPRVASRYGDLAALLNRVLGNDGRQNLEGLLNSLPRNEKNIFLARYQINQTFGANELFAGRGIALDKNGRFPAQVFLSVNGKNPQISTGTVLGLSGGDASQKAVALLEENGFFSNYQFLCNPKSAAMLGLSLALCQNLNALLSLEELAPEAFLPKAANQSNAPQQQSQLIAKNTFGDGEIAANAASRRAADNALASGALINGALLTIEKYRKAKFESVGLSADLRAEDGFRFAAGATGAMMGATIGCIAPLAEKSIGEILGFASSVVVGLTDAGLRTLGANALVAVITSGVQTFLDASSAKSLSGGENKFLNAADFYENDLGNNLFAARVDTFAIS